MCLCGSLVVPCVELYAAPPYKATVATLASRRADLFVQWIVLEFLLYARYGSHSGDTAVKKTNPKKSLPGVHVLVEETENTNKY